MLILTFMPAVRPPDDSSAATECGVPSEGNDMRRWTPRALPALLVCIGLPAAAAAQTPPPATPPVTPPAATTPTLPPPAAGQAGTVVVMPNGVIYMDPYHAATPYNPTVVNQAIPSPSLNRPITTLPCDNPNQNFDPYVPKKPGCNGLFHRKPGSINGSGYGCGCACAACGENTNHPTAQMIAHPYCGICSKGGTGTTLCNTSNFVFGSSNSYFGDSSREFFERPPSPDGHKMVPKAYFPAPAPAGYTSADIVYAKP
jgi:hypothetical protein